MLTQRAISLSVTKRRRAPVPSFRAEEPQKSPAPTKDAALCSALPRPFCEHVSPSPRNLSPAPVPPNRGQFALAVPIATGRCALDAFIQLGEVNAPARPKITYICAAIGQKPRAPIGCQGERWKVIGPSAGRLSPTLLRGRVNGRPVDEPRRVFRWGSRSKLSSSPGENNKTEPLGRGKPRRAGHFLCSALVLVAAACPAKWRRTWLHRMRPFVLLAYVWLRETHCRNRWPSGALTTLHRYS